MYYLVYLQDKNKSSGVQVTVCNETELASLLQHIDKGRYTVTEANALSVDLPSYKKFCQAEKGLETGKS